jgi:hypothetical protein
MKRMISTFSLTALFLHATLSQAGIAQQRYVALRNSPSAEVLDSHAIFRSLLRAPAPNLEAARKADELLAKMTLEEKVGQMTQLEISMVSTGRNQEIRIDPIKLEKAVGKYGVGSILNVGDQALTLDRWHETIRQIQD